MIEKTFVTPINERNNLKELKKHILLALNDNSGIMTEMDDGNHYSLLVAYPDAHNMVFDKIIRTELCRYFSYYFKIDYFREHLVLKNVNTIYAEIFIRALSRFDQNLDIKDIMFALYDFDTINLQSFFYFRLNNMKRRWENLIALTNDNSVWQLTKQSFEDLLKFLIANLEPQISFVLIDIQDKITKILDKDNNIITQKKIRAEHSHLWLAMALIKFSPKYICINHKNTKFNLSLINKLFTNKIHYK